MWHSSFRFNVLTFIDLQSNMYEYIHFVATRILTVPTDCFVVSDRGTNHCLGVLVVEYLERIIATSLLQ